MLDLSRGETPQDGPDGVRRLGAALPECQIE
jgi:hypothetical protein